MQDFQKGIFTLLQGAAYRVYGSDYALDPVTERPDKSLPYTWSNFAKFVRSMMELFKSLDIIEEACNKVRSEMLPKHTSETHAQPFKMCLCFRNWTRWPRW